MSPTTLASIAIMLASIAAAASVAAVILYAQRSARLVEMVAVRLAASPSPRRHRAAARNDDSSGWVSGSTAAPAWDPRIDPLGAGEHRRRQEQRYGALGDTDRMNALADGIAIGEGRRYGPNGPAVWQQQPPAATTPEPTQPWPNGQ